MMRKERNLTAMLSLEKRFLTIFCAPWKTQKVSEGVIRIKWCRRATWYQCLLGAIRERKLNLGAGLQVTSIGRLCGEIKAVLCEIWVLEAISKMPRLVCQLYDLIRDFLWGLCVSSVKSGLLRFKQSKLVWQLRIQIKTISIHFFTIQSSWPKWRMHPTKKNHKKRHFRPPSPVCLNIKCESSS